MMLDKNGGDFPHDEQFNTPGETGILYFDVVAVGDRHEDARESVARNGRRASGFSVWSPSSIRPPRRMLPGSSATSSFKDSEAKPEALVWVEISNGASNAWTPAGKFTLPIDLDESGAVKSADLANGIGEGLVSRLVRAQLNKKPQRVKGKLVYQVQVDNASPLDS